VTRAQAKVGRAFFCSRLAITFADKGQLATEKQTLTNGRCLVKIEESVERIDQALEDNAVHPDELALYTSTLTPVEDVVYREAQRRLKQLGSG
jgi:hypothetical protein